MSNIYNKELFTNLNLCDLLVTNDKLWKESLREYRLQSEDKYIRDKIMYRKIHCKIVADMAIDMFDCVMGYLDIKDSRSYIENLLFISCLTHDIKKFTRKHNVAGAEFIKEKLGDTKFCKDNNIPSFNSSVINEIYMLIVNHKSSNYFKEDTSGLNERMLMVIFMRFADKLSNLAVESKFRIISNESVDKKINECLAYINTINLNEKEQSLIKKITIDIKQYFVTVYCSNKIGSF